MVSSQEAETHATPFDCERFTDSVQTLEITFFFCECLTKRVHHFKIISYHFCE
jgi:hypothetical protein